MTVFLAILAAVGFTGWARSAWRNTIRTLNRLTTDEVVWDLSDARDPQLRADRVGRFTAVDRRSA